MISGSLRSFEVASDGWCSSSHAMAPSADLRALKEAFVSNLTGTSKWEIWTVISCLPVNLYIGAVLQHCLAAAATHGRQKQQPGWLLTACFACDFAAVVLPQAAVSMSAVGPVALLLCSLCVAVVLTGCCLGISFLPHQHSSSSVGQQGAASQDPPALQQDSSAAARQQSLQQQHADDTEQQQQQQQQQRQALQPTQVVWRLRNSPALQQLCQPRLSFISWFRGGSMLYTCLAILAVDFHAFPRRFAKAEHHGTGLMDLGVGATIFAGGLVSKPGAAGAQQCGWRRLLGASSSTLPVLLLGAGRLLSVKATNYQEHVGEYGVHWNFFLTIAGVNLMTHVVNPGRTALPLAAAVLVVYQLLLTRYGLSQWVHSEERGPGWVSLNKEGMCSLSGYWALYLLGSAAGHWLRRYCLQLHSQLTVAGNTLDDAAGSEPAHTPRPARGRQLQQQQQQPVYTPQSVQQQQGPLAVLVWRLLGWVTLDVLLWSLLWVVETYVEPISRRSCNMAYVIWVVAQCSDQLLLCFLGQGLSTLLATSTCSKLDHQDPDMQPSEGQAVSLAEAFNYNLLALFLGANLLTGLVNFSVNTLAVSDWLARLIVGTYMLAVCSIAAALHKHKVAVKLG